MMEFWIWIKFSDDMDRMDHMDEMNKVGELINGLRDCGRGCELLNLSWRCILVLKSWNLLILSTVSCIYLVRTLWKRNAAKNGSDVHRNERTPQVFEDDVSPKKL